MESQISLKEKAGNYDVVVEIQARENPGESSDLQETMENISTAQMSLLMTNPTSTQTTLPPSQVQIITPPPDSSPVQRRMSAYSKPKSRIAEPQFSKKPALEQQMAQTKFPVTSSPNNTNLPNPNPKNTTPKTSAPITPRTPLMASMGGDDDDDNDDNDDDVYRTENLKVGQAKKGKKVKIMVFAEWFLFVSIMAVLILSRTVDRLRGAEIWSLELWKWCVLVVVIFCGRLFTGWLINTLVFSIEKNFLLKKKVLYFVFGLKKSVRVVIWLALILLAWALLINRGVRRTEETSRVLNYITRAIVSTLVGAVMWMAKTLLVKIIASNFHVRTYFDRIQESIYHQYILQALSRAPAVENGESRFSGTLSFSRGANSGKKDTNEDVINVDKLYKMKREKVSAWTMGGLIQVIRNSELPTVSEVLDESVEEEGFGGPKVITSEVEAHEAANRIFRNVAKPGHRYIEEDDFLLFMPKEEVDNAFPLFEGAAESRRIKSSSFRIWVVKAYNERKCLAVSLKDAKTAIEELNKIASGIILVLIIIVWLLLMEITTTTVLVFISSQMLLAIFMFGNTVKTVFEAMIFVFIVHPFDVGDRCVIDGVQMIVDEMNILTTIFLKADNEKVYYPNSVLATKAVSNFNRSPEMMGDTVEFAVDFNTSVESIAALKAKIKGYLESKPQHWSPSHSVQVKEIVDVNKMLMALYVTHTINFQNAGERGERRSALVFELKKIFEELGITYRLLPQEVQIKNVDSRVIAAVTGGGQRS